MLLSQSSVDSAIEIKLLSGKRFGESFLLPSATRQNKTHEQFQPDCILFSQLSVTCCYNHQAI